ncbi:MAG TPA: DAK2 domain-containing protein [Anaerolineales bacterium]|nr:DAK2 domain-containing protein [Anaerolineales bacterium]
MKLESQSLLIAKRQEQFRIAPIDGQALKKLIETGLTWLRTNQQTVNVLNVFPVPDGDTGINMVLTMQSAYDEIAGSPERNFGKIAHAVAHGALMGARGNSGVILSQLWRGFARGVDNLELLDGPTMARAFAEARDTAYKGVVRPVEGTILTVAKDSATAAREALQETEDPIRILERVVAAADKSVEHTPELLAELKKAGVVDAGGKGLFFLMEGMLRYINGLQIDSPVTSVQPLSAMNLEDTLETIEPGQDYEVVVDFQPQAPLNLEKFYDDLQKMGTSIQVGEGDGIYRMHIHVPTEKLHEPVDYTMSLGTITKVSMENLIKQMEAIERKARGGRLNLARIEPGQIAVVAVSPGPGIARVFASLGVAAIVEGGQTMNPSTQDILSAFENLPTDQVIILPNNKNIILAANSAAELTVKNVAVIPSRTIPEGLAAMLRLVPEGDFDAVIAEMTEALDEVQTGEITTAIRDADIDGVHVREGEIIALFNRKLVHSTNNLEAACLGLLEKANAADYELVTLFYGSDVTKQDANQIADTIRIAYPNLDVELQDGGQPHYQFIISIE